MLLGGKKEDSFKEGTLNKFQKLLLLIGIAVIFVGSIKEVGFSVPSFLLSLTSQKDDDGSISLELIKRGIYLLTDLKIGQPESIIASILCSRNSQKATSQQLAEVKGYFDQDENSYLTKEQAAAEEPEIQEESSALSLPDLSNLNDVYTHYFSASGKMDFGLDMIEKWDFNALARKPLSIEKTASGPQVLIFHTHAREEYIGGKTVVDVGEALKQTLEQQYGLSVLHIKDDFYESTNHTKYPTKVEYEIMEPVIEKVLKEHPSISVVMDIHRDGVDAGVHLVTDIDGRPTAKIMFVNGLCLNRNLQGKVEQKADLPNPYLEDNLAFSLQSEMTMNALYPGLSRKIYFNEWRYSTHMKPQSLLIEWGADTNTGEEALNAVEPMAKVLMTVLNKD